MFINILIFCQVQYCTVILICHIDIYYRFLLHMYEGEFITKNLLGVAVGRTEVPVTQILKIKKSY